MLDDVSLQVRPGEFVAIVGAVGLGQVDADAAPARLRDARPGHGHLRRPRAGHARPARGAPADRRRAPACPAHARRHLQQHRRLRTRRSRMDDAWQAARLAGLEDDIRAMPMGMHTLVGEGGGNLSGGQRQRLLIARAIVRRPRILLLDEATSALDNVTQAIVSDSLTSQLRGVTRLVIAHRLDHRRQGRPDLRPQGGPDRPVGTIPPAAGRARAVPGAGAPAVALTRPGSRRATPAHGSPTARGDLQALSAQVLALPGVARATDLRPAALGDRRAIGPSPPFPALTMSRLRLHVRNPILLVGRRFIGKADPLPDLSGRELL